MGCPWKSNANEQRRSRKIGDLFLTHEYEYFEAKANESLKNIYARFLTFFKETSHGWKRVFKMKTQTPS